MIGLDTPCFLRAISKGISKDHTWVYTMTLIQAKLWVTPDVQLSFKLYSISFTIYKKSYMSEIDWLAQVMLKKLSCCERATLMID